MIELGLETVSTEVGCRGRRHPKPGSRTPRVAGAGRTRARRATAELRPRRDRPGPLQMLAPSFNFQSSAITDGTDSVRPATLRGLGPDQVLVLVNGKRRHNSALLHVLDSVGRGTRRHGYECHSHRGDRAHRGA